MPEDNSQEVLDLKKKVEELEDKLRKVGLEVPADIEGLSKGSDKFSIEFSFETKNPKLGKNGITYWIKGDEYDHSIETTWDLLFSYLAPEIISPTSEYRIVSRLNEYIVSRARKYFNKTFSNNKIE